MVNRLLPLFLAAAVCSACLLSCGRVGSVHTEAEVAEPGTPDQGPGGGVPGQAPAFSLAEAGWGFNVPDPWKRATFPADILALDPGNPVILAFFAGPSEKAFPTLVDLWERGHIKQWRLAGMPILCMLDRSLTWSEITAATREGFFPRAGFTLPLAADRDGRVAKAYGVQQRPTYVIIGQDGKEAARFAVNNDEELDRLIAFLDPFVAERSPASPGSTLPSFSAECLTPQGLDEFTFPVVDRETGQCRPSVILSVSPQREESLEALSRLEERMQAMHGSSANFIVLFGGNESQARAAVDLERNPCYLLPDPEGKLGRMLLIRESPTIYLAKVGITLSAVHEGLSDSLWGDLASICEMAAWAQPGEPVPTVDLSGLFEPEQRAILPESDDAVLVFVMSH